MTFFNAAGLWLAGHLPPFYVILVLSAMLATGLVASVPGDDTFHIEQKTGPDL